MDDSPQNLYAKNLQQSFGYPLRFPEPKPGLPSSYGENGLHIGDVGYVDDHGMFQVQFNICFSPDHELHRASREDLVGLVGLAKFNPNEVPPIPNAFPFGRVICRGIQGSHDGNLKHTPGQSAPCKFMSCSTSGAILILPSGAVLQNLNDNKEAEFRKLTEKHAFDWCQFAHRESIYLITGFYKTSSWYLASFDDARPTEPIILGRDDTGRYIWNPKCDHRESPRENYNENQTILILGFKIKVRRWDKHTVIEKLVPRSRSIWSELISLASSLLRILVFFWQQIASRGVLKVWGGMVKNLDGDAHVDRVPALSQPFHPSNVINRYLLDKNPNIQVAITHDSQWLTMLEKNELPYEDMIEEARFRTFLEEKYTGDCNSGNVGYLRRKTDEPNSANHSELRKSVFFPKKFSLPAPLGDIRQIVVTRMRVENAVTGLKRMPVGFYVLIQFGGTKRRSKIKSVLLHDSIIEWDDEIMMPTDPKAKVRFSVHASFEFEPTLGNGETLCVLEISVGSLAQNGSTYLQFSFSGGKDASSCRTCPSLLITLEERCFNSFADWSQGDSNLGCEDQSRVGVGEATDKGHNALLHYHRDHGIVELKESVECFKRALDLCPSDHQSRAAALFNLATARFINCQVHGTISDLEEVISSYREVLVLRPAPHPDRLGTLLQLAQALLYRYGRLRRDASVANKIEGLVTEVKQICCEDRYEHRAADLVLQTLKRYQAETSGQLAEIDKLISKLGRSVRMPPHWYFDRPYRLINFGAVLCKRFELAANLDHIEKSISVIEEAAQLIPDGHFDKPWVLASLGDALCVRFARRGDVSDLDKSISMIEDAVKLTPDGHVEKPWMLSRLGAVFLVRFICRDPSGLGKSISMTGSALHLTPKARLDRLDNLVGYIATASLRIGDLNDLERAISRHRDAVELLLDGNPLQPDCLTNLASSLLTRFWCLGNPSDLDKAVSMFKEVVEVTPDGHPDQPGHLNNLAFSLRARFQRFGKLSVLKEAISTHKDAVRLIPSNHPDKPGYLSNLNDAISRYKDSMGYKDSMRYKDPISRCRDPISAYEDAVEPTSDGYSDNPGRLIHNVRKSNDLIHSISGKWANWDLPIPVDVGDYGKIDRDGKLVVEGNIYDDYFQKHLDENDIKLDLKSHQPKLGGPKPDYIVASVTKSEFDVNRYTDVSGIASASIKGTWEFQSGKRGALVIVHKPRQKFIPTRIQTMIFKAKLLEGKKVVTDALTCSAYLVYLSHGSGGTVSVALCGRTAETDAVTSEPEVGWFTQNHEGGLLRRAFNPRGEYCFIPLFSLRSEAKYSGEDRTGRIFPRYGKISVNPRNPFQGLGRMPGSREEPGYIPTLPAKNTQLQGYIPLLFPKPPA